MKKKVFWIVLFVITVVLTPKVFEYADIQRGYDGTGGEIFFPLLVPIAYGIWDTVKSFVKEIWSEE